MDKQLIDRATSHFGISIGTGLALASFFEATSDVYVPADGSSHSEHYDLVNVKTFYINIHTLIRNIVQSVPDTKSFLNKRIADDVYEILVEELGIVDSLFNNVDTELIYFLPDYTKVYRSFTLKDKRNIPSQKDLTQNIIGTVSKKVDVKALNYTFLSDTFLLPRSVDETIILTHYAHDLLNVTRVPNLLHSASITGKVYGKMFFNKYYRGISDRKFDRLPFLEVLLHITGDSTGLFKNNSIKDRRALMDMSVEYRWNPASTLLKIKTDSRRVKDIHDLVKGRENIYR